MRMIRLLVVCIAVAGLLPIGASIAASSGPGSTGEIAFIGEYGCTLSTTTRDGTLVFAFGAAGGTYSFEFLGGANSLADPRLGFICTGTPFYTGIPEGDLPLVVTGLTCKLVWDNPFTPQFPTRTLAHKGTAIFYTDGTVRLICPPG
jgi:hypothetical protein